MSGTAGTLRDEARRGPLSHVRVLDFTALVQGPQEVYNGAFWEVPMGDGHRTSKALASPFVFSETHVGIHRIVPDPGQQTAELFGATAAGRDRRGA